MKNLLVLHTIREKLPKHFEDVSAAILMEILSNQKYRFSTLDQISECAGEQLQVGLTFDDGNSSDYYLVLPALQKNFARATFFVVNRWLNLPGFLTSEQVRELHRAGMQIGSHSVSHPDFRKLSTTEQCRELDESRKTLEDLTGSAISAFAFPYGFKNKAAIDAVMAAGYKYCCASDHGVVSSAARVMPRNSIHSGMSCAAVRRVLEAGWSTRLAWKLEDNGKAAMKSSFPRVYPTIRALLVRK